MLLDDGPFRATDLSPRLSGVLRRRAPLVVLNCPDPPPGFDPTARYDLLRARLGLDAARPIVLYQGWMAEGRGLEQKLGDGDAHRPR